MVAEYGDRGGAGFYASWPQAGVPLGLPARHRRARPVRPLLPGGAFLAWGWRVPFLLSVVLIVRRPADPPARAGDAAVPAGESGAAGAEAADSGEVLAHAPPQRPCLSMGARAWRRECLFLHLQASGSLSYATQQLGLPKSSLSLNGVLLGSAAQLVADTLFRRDVGSRGAPARVPRGRSVSLSPPAAFPFFWLVDTKNIALVWDRDHRRHDRPRRPCTVPKPRSSPSFSARARATPAPRSAINSPRRLPVGSRRSSRRRCWRASGSWVAVSVYVVAALARHGRRAVVAARETVRAWISTQRRRSASCASRARERTSTAAG